MSLRFAVVYEAEADFKTATDLADRVLVESVDWLDAEHLPYVREWVAVSADGHRLTWASVRELAKKAEIKAHGRFTGQPGHPDARAARRAILYLLATVPELAGIMLIRDQDNQPTRRDGLEQARRSANGRVPVVVGLAVPEREAWVICGFDPADESEQSRLEAIRHELGFDPRWHGHQLTAGRDDSALRSPKRVVRILCDSSAERVCRCWCEPALSLLRERGGSNGLAEYLDDVRDRLAGLIGHRPTPVVP